MREVLCTLSFRPAIYGHKVNPEALLTPIGPVSRIANACPALILLAYVRTAERFVRATEGAGTQETKGETDAKRRGKSGAG